ncbi:MAG TPA: helix-turn-helix domain-containing protein [Mycobacteriales bacterium]|nr:helix-turn-helix domain-containing protein [Mycobacteriales bacterium]
MSFDTRRITDPRALRAISHPVRVALLELLAMDGPLTATQAGTRLDESPANCSFHLRTLARYGFVEEAEGGTGRQRPWQIVPQVTEVRGEEMGPAGQIATGALIDLIHQREADQAHTWRASRDRYPAAWREAAGELRGLVFLTATELAQLNRDIEHLLAGYAARADPARRPAGSLPVSMLLRTFPLRPPSDEPPAEQSPAREPGTP